MIYRPLTDADQAAWRGLRLEGLKLYPLNFLTTYDEQLARSEEEDRAFLRHGTMRGLFDGDRLVAMTALVREKPAAARHRAYLGAFLTAQSHQRRGLGRRMIAEVKAEAIGQGVWQLELYVAATNLGAQALYRSEGFEQVGVLPNATVMQGVAADDLFMVCDLRG